MKYEYSSQLIQRQENSAYHHSVFQHLLTNIVLSKNSASLRPVLNVLYQGTDLSCAVRGLKGVGLKA
jgi:hypothetical protein